MNFFSLICILGLAGTAIAQSACDSGWEEYNGKCYYIQAPSVPSWDDARTACQGMGGDLVVINNQAENNFLQNLIPNTGRLGYWIGLTDAATEGTFVWVDSTVARTGGVDSLYTNWQEGEPNQAGDENCITMDTANYNHNYFLGGWNDVACTSAEYGYFCEKIPTTTPPTSPPTPPTSPPTSATTAPPTSPPTPDCTPPEVLCSDGSTCYDPSTQSCDGSNDCTDGSDEAKCGSLRQMVAFMAVKTTNQKGAPGDVVTFQETETNIGNAFDTTTSTFTSPVSGLFEFNFHISIKQYSYPVISLMKISKKNGVSVIISTFESPENNLHISSNTASVQLDAGDKVQLQFKARSGAIKNSNYGINEQFKYSSFSGVMLY
ncbi:uncharacterized protein [Amphiura filiformis]|uniref:uncharacterized protein n=1 Tax=Amphiura filiformis TaxID=82378 RepID=UPI003B21941C